MLADALGELRGFSQLRNPLRVRFLGLDDMEEAGVGEGLVEARVSESRHSCVSTASPPPVVGPPSLPPKSSTLSCALPAGSATWSGVWG